MSEPYSINIHVMHGNPNGVLLVTRPSDWNGSAIVLPKEDFEPAKEAGILDNAGVYILWSKDLQAAPDRFCFCVITWTRPVRLL